MNHESPPEIVPLDKKSAMVIGLLVRAIQLFFRHDSAFFELAYLSYF
jgi:hypothetical protein